MRRADLRSECSWADGPGEGGGLLEHYQSLGGWKGSMQGLCGGTWHFESLQQWRLQYGVGERGRGKVAGQV